MRKPKGLRTLFTMVGTVIGAGFVSGRELLQFFGGFRVSAVYFAGLLFFLCFLLFLRLGKMYGGFEGVLTGVFKKCSKPVKAVILFGSFVSSAGMLSGLNSLVPQAKPFLTLAFLVFACFVSEKGIKGVGTINCIVMPVLLVSVAAMIFKGGALSPSEPPEAEFPLFLSILLYVAMNTFLSLPVLCDLGAEIKSGASLLCAISTFIVAAAIGLILSAVCSDKNSFAYDLPLSYILGGAKFFSVLACGGMLTTLLSSFYPLYSLAGRRWGTAGKFALFALTECCSFIGFKSIVANVYPALGIFGLTMTIFCAAVYLEKTVFRGKKRRSLPARTKAETRGAGQKFFVKKKKDFD